MPSLKIILDEHHEPAHRVSKAGPERFILDTRNLIRQLLALAPRSLGGNDGPRPHNTPTSSPYQRF
jgi:hypothetical protein